MKSRPCLQFKEGNVVSASYQGKDLEWEFGENKPESRVRPRMGVGVDGVIKKLLRSSGGRRIVWAAERGGAELSLREVPPHAVCKSPVPWSQWYGRDDCCVSLQSDGHSGKSWLRFTEAVLKLSHSSAAAPRLYNVDENE
ncbi:hypothetical protein Y1Q_0002646 [Alligator mississippiensis]|uniref:Uncharacterized protein n=1 Tax=Alligator mississippiensis TaxID=8496 RepID=A0A151NYX5_ALLMI|nr:hypothetical protein Y1Q_0002646 [Alligator mississippiensis]